MIPRRRDYLMGWGLFFGLSGGFILFSANAEDELNKESLSVQHVLLAQLGPEHIASATYRRGLRGDSLVAWGDRILEWSLTEKPEMREVVPAQSGQVYANGGCVLDVNDDGVEEVILARGRAPAYSHSRLFWFQSSRTRPLGGNIRWRA